MTDRVCTVCGRRVEAAQVVRSRYPDAPLQMYALLEHCRKKRRERPPKEQECHRVWLPSGRIGVGHWMEHEGLCGPLRMANAQDDFLEQVGVKA